MMGQDDNGDVSARPGETGDGSRVSRRSLIKGVIAGSAGLAGTAAWARPAAAGTGLANPDNAVNTDDTEFCAITDVHATEAVGRRSQAPAPGLPEEIGEWSPVLPGFFGHVPIHGALLYTGEVLCIETTFGFLWNPVTDTAIELSPLPENFLCAGHSYLANGDLYVAGGIYGHTPMGPPWNYFFRAKTRKWREGQESLQGRYYPTCTTLPKGQIVVTTGKTEDGRTFNDDVEVLTGAALAKVGTKHIGLYPHQWVLPNGLMISGGPDYWGSYLLDPATWLWTDVPDLAEDHHHGGGFMLPGPPSGSYKVMITGGQGSRLVEMFDGANPNAGWTAMNPLPEVRENMNTVLLPDGTGLGVGGNDESVDPFVPTLQTLLYNPSTDTWAPGPSQVMRRGYHSIALLLPDGRVLSSGDNHPGGGNETMEIYSPPYLFKGPRPTITLAPTAVRPAQAFNITTPDTIARVVLMRPGAVTHSNNMTQSHIELTFSPVAGGVRAYAPPSNNVAPAGYYMLMVLNPDGVPSVASWIQVKAV